MITLMDDTLASLMDGPRAHGAFLLESVLHPPWGLRIEDEAPLSLVTMVSGEAWILRDSEEPVLLREQDVAVLRGPHPYTIADTPHTPPHAVVRPGQVCTNVSGESMAGDISPGTRRWGKKPDGGSAVMLSGTYQQRTEIGMRLLAALPPVLVHTPADDDVALVRLLSAEMGLDRPGQELVLDRILDLLLVKIVRSWLSSPRSGAPQWCLAQSDPVVGAALRVMHKNPELGWTVARLAERTGVSRATFARKFTTLLGESPMNYLTSRRLSLGADLLMEPDSTLSAVARRVGYSSPFAFSAAFKRERGMSPLEHRRRTLGVTAGSLTAAE
ncbi:AraC family transcriptional regulator [Arthrobacter tecti]